MLKKIKARELISALQRHNRFDLFGKCHILIRPDLSFVFFFKNIGTNYANHKTVIRYRKINRIYPIYYN